VAYTYSGNPNSSLVDATHYHLGNTNPADPLATDEECAYALAMHRNHPMLAAAALAESKAAQFAMRPTMVRRGERITSYGDAAQAFLLLARQLRSTASLATTAPYAGGIERGEKEAEHRDARLVRPWARVDLHTPPSLSDTATEARDL
jgi:hypothetical protein